MNKQFSTGNVVKTGYGNIVIITGFRDNYYHWVSFDTSNSSGYTCADTYSEKLICYNNSGGICNDEKCVDCKGTGSYMVERKGMNQSKLLGSSVKDYIMKSLTSNFGFNYNSRF